MFLQSFQSCEEHLVFLIFLVNSNTWGRGSSHRTEKEHMIKTEEKRIWMNSIFSIKTGEKRIKVNPKGESERQGGARGVILSCQRPVGNSLPLPWQSGSI